MVLSEIYLFHIRIIDYFIKHISWALIAYQTLSIHIMISVLQMRKPRLREFK